jgi:hypothetical protein
MLMMILFSLYFQQVYGLRFYPAACRSACIVITPTLQVDRHHRNHRNHHLVEIDEIMYNNPIKAVLKKQSGFLFYFYMFSILIG